VKIKPEITNKNILKYITQFRPISYIFTPILGRWNNSLFPFCLNNITINIPVKLVEIISLPYIDFF
jgi:hypothetical protein